jgi:hypothetical protein
MLGGRPRDKFREDAPAHSAHRGDGADVIKVFASDTCDIARSHPSR